MSEHALSLPRVRRKRPLSPRGWALLVVCFGLALDIFTAIVKLPAMVHDLGPGGVLLAGAIVAICGQVFAWLWPQFVYEWRRRDE